MTVSPQIGPGTEERETFTRLQGHHLKGTEKGCGMPRKAIGKSNAGSDLASGLTQVQSTQRHTREEWEKLSNAQKVHAWWSGTEPAKTPEEQMSHLLGWYDVTLDASYWFNERHCIPAAQAAQMLSQTNPLDTQQVEIWLEQTSWKGDVGGIPLMSPKDRKKLLWSFEEVGGERTLIEWLKIAKERGWQYDPWVDEYIAARNASGSPLSHQSGANHSALAESGKTGEVSKDGVKGVDGKPPSSSTIAAAPAHAPAPVVAVNLSDAPAWTVSKPQRYNGYTAPLHRLLAAAHRDGKTCPTARDVVEDWRNNTPAEIAKVLPDGFDYYDAKGDTKTADLEAIRKAIGRMTSAR